MKKRAEQKVIFTLSHDGKTCQTVNIAFEPGLAGEAKFKKLPKIQRYLQNTAAEVAAEVLKALGKE